MQEGIYHDNFVGHAHPLVEQNRALLAAVAKLEGEVVALRDVAVHIYNSGYHAGHNAIVEGGYVDIYSNDMNTYHAEEVAELLAALVGEEGR